MTWTGNLPPPPNPASTDPHASAFAQIQALLSRYGLGSLANWAWKQIVDGNNADQIAQSIRTTPEWKTRFKAILDRQAKGLPPISESQVVAYEEQAVQTMRSAGFPPGFYDKPEDFVTLIGNDVSIAELNNRIGTEWAKVEKAPREVRAAFADYFGPQGDTALAMTFVDPQRSLTQLQQMADAAIFGGEGRVSGFGIDAATARRAAEQGVTQGAAESGFQKLAGERAYQTATVGEGDIGQHDVRDEQAVGAQFGFDPAAEAARVARQAGREAQFKGSKEGQITSQGDISLGTVKPVKPQ